MYIHIEEPTEKISTNAITIWRISNTIGHAVALLITAILIFCADQFDWYRWVEITLYFIGGFLSFSAIYSILIGPTLTQRYWRYKIDEQFVQLKNGKWNENHTLIPMEKVEYVRTEQGPILRRYGLYNIIVGTTTSNHTLPAIPIEVAMKLKAQIATFAKIKDSGMEDGGAAE
ncbi:MAG: PH domain-containing protein [Bacillota bacterium]